MSALAVDLLTLLRLPGVGPRAAVRLAATDLEEQKASKSWATARAEAENLASECAELGIGIAGWFDTEFPGQLREIPDPPAVLYFRGDLRAAHHPYCAAVVGTRHPSPWGEEATRTLSQAFASEGWSIVSGLAIGVDTLAHQTALDSAGPTIAVLGNGLASVYPAANRNLAEKILAAGGLLLAEVPPRQKVEPRTLVKRDRLQSGLAAITVVCQGGSGSGAMHTARYAFEQGRPLFCAALARGDEPPGDEDTGTRALLEEPTQRLPELLPAWKRTAQRHLGPEPAAQPLAETALSNLAALHHPAPAPRLF